MQLGVTQLKMHESLHLSNIFSAHWLCVLKVFGEEHESTSKSYRELDMTQFDAQQHKAALQSVMRALGICIQMIEEDHKRTIGIFRTLENIKTFAFS